MNKNMIIRLFFIAAFVMPCAVHCTKLFSGIVKNGMRAFSKGTEDDAVKCTFLFNALEAMKEELAQRKGGIQNPVDVCAEASMKKFLETIEEKCKPVFEELRKKQSLKK